MWSAVEISGKPSILFVDASRNLEGWEFDFSQRLMSGLARSGLVFVPETPVRIEKTQELEPHLSNGFNCILFFAHGKGEHVEPFAEMKTHWQWLNSRPDQSARLFAGVTCQSYDPEASQLILKSPAAFAPLALAPTSTNTPREAGLFLLKFFTELNLHSHETISGKMVWFSSSKAKELLRKRRYSAKFGVRC